MTKPSKSPERHTFQQNNYIKRQEEQGLEPLEEYIEMFKTWRQQDEDNMANPEWQENNLEYDLRTTEWILAKARASDSYAQNIYAAMCNMRWCNIKGTNPQVTMDILKDEFWSCSWRSAGGIVADMLQKGDYIDWYCSGMGGLSGYDKDSETYEEWQVRTKYVPEGVVTEEIRGDFATLGWVPSPWPDDKK